MTRELHQFAELIPEPILILDGRGRVLAANRALGRRLAREPGGLIGRPLGELLADDPEKIEELLRGCGRSRTPIPLALSLRSGEGGAERLRLRGARIGGTRDDAPFRIVLQVTDRENDSNRFVQLTELLDNLKKEVRRRTVAEAALRYAKSQAESANRSKDEFLANMSHEIRTPLTSILGFAELLDEEDDQVRSGHAETIRRSGAHLLRIVDDVLELSRIEARTVEYQRIRFRPRDLLDDAVSIASHEAAAKGLCLRTECADDVPESVLGDPLRLRQVLLNLVGNALKFTEQGSVHVSLRCEAEPPTLRFDVVDTGIGIAVHDLDRMFDPFVQADTSSTRRHGGTGLGLAISRRLSDGMGATLDVQSTPGSGSRFSLALPLQGAIEPAPSGGRSPARTEESGPTRPVRVLLAEDHPDNRRYVECLLGKAGADVSCAEDGRVALEMVAQVEEPYDLILMDMQMPRLDGYEATAELRRRGYQGVIVAITAHAMREDEERCLSAGCDAYEAKPLDRKRLLALLELPKGPSL